eukprot:TRINITY_DN647_c0_g2_i2.p1 TRINITY_DN647_c0_g2~~TRINITY_DN647_c0_g2_i2.p1  ORF type:complete len:599 (+),score=168.44 TRINITY_DN647_c0_g2_i2:49-1797(+)
MTATMRLAVALVAVLLHAAAVGGVVQGGDFELPRVSMQRQYRPLYPWASSHTTALGPYRKKDTQPACSEQRQFLVCKGNSCWVKVRVRTSPGYTYRVQYAVDEQVFKGCVPEYCATLPETGSPPLECLPCDKPHGLRIGDVERFADPVYGVERCGVVPVFNQFQVDFEATALETAVTWFPKNISANPRGNFKLDRVSVFMVCGSELVPVDESLQDPRAVCPPTPPPTPAPPSAAPTFSPSAAPSVAPSAAPTVAPTAPPVSSPTQTPSAAPERAPSSPPSVPPSTPPEPAAEPVRAPPSEQPSGPPSDQPSGPLSPQPSTTPSAASSVHPFTGTPLPQPTKAPSAAPSTDAPSAPSAEDPAPAPSSGGSASVSALMAVMMCLASVAATVLVTVLVMRYCCGNSDAEDLKAVKADVEMRENSPYGHSDCESTARADGVSVSMYSMAADPPGVMGPAPTDGSVQGAAQTDGDSVSLYSVHEDPRGVTVLKPDAASLPPEADTESVADAASIAGASEVRAAEAGAAAPGDTEMDTEARSCVAPPSTPGAESSPVAAADLDVPAQSSRRESVAHREREPFFVDDDV